MYLIYLTCINNLLANSDKVISTNNKYYKTLEYPKDKRFAVHKEINSGKVFVKISCLKKIYNVKSGNENTITRKIKTFKKVISTANKKAILNELGERENSNLRHIYPLKEVVESLNTWNTANEDFVVWSNQQ